MPVQCHRQVISENRVRIYQLSADALRGVFADYRLTDHAILRILPTMPEDARILSINADWQTGSVQLLVEHASFEPVPQGEIPPILPELSPRAVVIDLTDRQKAQVRQTVRIYDTEPALA